MFFKNTLILIVAGMLCMEARAQQAGNSELDWELTGHGKYQFLLNRYPDNSIFNPAVGSQTQDNHLEIRLNNAWNHGRWSLQADYQFIASHAQSLDLAPGLPGSQPGSQVISDRRRWWNLTHTNRHGDHTVFINRLDRLHVSYTGDRTVWRFGRQAISWGNGMMFTPMDIFNPFDPAAVDKEYKTGDDMLYGQYLFNDGSDLQGTLVVRRDPISGDTETDQSSLAFKYHGFAADNEFDLLMARHYGDDILAVGGNWSPGGAVIRGDVTWTRTDTDSYWSAVTSLSYSWTWAGKNVSGVLEYFHNGFGQKAGNYSPSDLVLNPDLVARLARGELFTLSRNYIGASALIELNPLLRLTPNLFLNTSDSSALAQLVMQYDWTQDLQVLAAINIPIGDDGTEYGGIESPVEGYFYSSGPGLFVQAAWYF